MKSDATVCAMIDALEGLEVPYMLVGSLSCNQYAIPRSTHDADFVIQYEPGILKKIIDVLGESFHLDSQSRFEAITGTTRNVIDVEGQEFCIELFRLSEDPHDQERFRRRVRGVHSGHSVWIPTAEDVIIWKLRWALNRIKDQEDVREIVSVQAGVLDWTYIRAWAERHGTREMLAQIVASIPRELLEGLE